MRTRSSALLACALLALAVADPAAAQSSPPAGAPGEAADAAPTPESGAPDPLAPKDKAAPAPLAPGAASAEPTAPRQAEAQPAAEVDAVIAEARKLLASRTPGRGAGDKDDLAAATAVYGERTAPIWTDKTGLAPHGRQALDEIRKADDWGLNAAAFDMPEPPTAQQPTALAEVEIKVALAVLKYARHARGGRFDPASISRKFDQQPTIFEPRSVLQGIAAADSADAYLRSLHPQHPQFERLRQALLAARAAPAADATRERASASVQQIVANMERWRWMPADLGSFYVWDSIPDQMTSVVDNGKTVLSEKIVVGKLSSPTPIFSADMQFVIFHPSWGVPPGMKSNELLPKLRETGGGGWFSSNPLASDVLKAHGLRATRGGAPVDPDAIDWKTANITNFEFEQAPGPTNVLGAVKFRFPNKHDVYMHDTPERNLFGGAVRAFSHGCMRVQNPIHLAEVLLQHDKGWSVEQIRDQSRHGGEIKLTTPIPVHVTYFTASVDDSGKLVTRPDIYGLDGRLVSAMFGRDARPIVTGSLGDGEPVAPRVRASAGSSTGATSPTGNPRVATHGKRGQRKGATAAAVEKPFNPFNGIFGPQ